MPHPEIGRYNRQILEARRVGLALTARQVRVLLRILRDWTDELTSAVRLGLATREQVERLQLIRELAHQLRLELATAMGEGVRVTARRMAELHAEATLALVESAGVAGVRASIEAFTGVGLSAAQSVLARPELSRAFVSIGDEVAETVDEILIQAAARGASARSLEMELRTFVLGADEIPERLLLDRRRIGFDAIEAMGYEPTPENLQAVRAHAARVSNRARLIGRHELMVAEHEAGVRLAEASPVVKAVDWFLSNRHPAEDECDVLAGATGADFYGLGAGLYPPERVPARPHPRCLCGRRHKLLDPEQWGEGRGEVPGLRVQPADVADSLDMNPSRTRSLRRAIAIGEQRAAA